MMWKKLLFYRGATERKIKGEEFGSGCSCYVLSLDVYYCVELYDRYMHQILMPLCLMNTVYKHVLVWFLLTAVSAQHTSTCRPDPTHEYKTNGPLSLISKVAIPPLCGCCYSLLYCFSMSTFTKDNVSVHHTLLISFKMDLRLDFAQKLWFFRRKIIAEVSPKWFIL